MESLKNWMVETANIMFDDSKNDLRSLPKSVRLQILIVLSFIWSTVFSLYVFSLTSFIWGWAGVVLAHIGLIIAVYITFKFFHKANIEKKSVFETGNYNPAKIFVVFFIIFFIFIFTKGIDVLTRTNSYSIEYDGPVKSTLERIKSSLNKILMCGRFAQTNIIKSTSDIVKTVIGKVENKDNFNISPGQEAAVIKKYSNGRALELGHWSILPGWAKDKEGFKRLHNTRLESLIKPYFKRLITKNRLLIPCSYFYEWSKSEENKKIPYCFKSRIRNEIMYFAGIFENSEFSIITREATEENSKIHHRQPLIIGKSKINDFLNLKNDAIEVLNSIKPPNLFYHRISLEINNPKNNFEKLIEPL